MLSADKIGIIHLVRNAVDHISINGSMRGNSDPMSNTLKCSPANSEKRDSTKLRQRSLRNSRVKGVNRSRGRKRAPASVNRELEVLSRIFTLAVDQDQATVNPCHKVKKLLMDNARTRCLSVEEEEKLLEVMTGRLAHLRAIAIVAIDTGLRRRELLSLEKEQVDFDLNVINLKRTKNGKGRTVPMTSRVAEELKQLCENSDGRYFFANSETGKAITDVKHSFTSAVRASQMKKGRMPHLP
jgi:integrase